MVCATLVVLNNTRQGVGFVVVFGPVRHSRDELGFALALAAACTFPGLNVVQDDTKLRVVGVQRFFEHQELAKQAHLERHRLPFPVFVNGSAKRCISGNVEVKVLGLVHALFGALCEITSLDIEAINSRFFVQIKVVFCFLLLVDHGRCY